MPDVFCTSIDSMQHFDLSLCKSDSLTRVAPSYHLFSQKICVCISYELEVENICINHSVPGGATHD